MPRKKRIYHVADSTHYNMRAYLTSRRYKDCLPKRHLSYGSWFQVR